jgi:hypothetical protein
MRCPDCCAGITALPKSLKSFYNWDYVVNSAKYFQGMGITLTGGEASVHPLFEEFVPKIKELFNSPNLSVWTNGTMFQKKPDVWKHFDVIHISNYTAESFDGSPDNTKAIEWIRDHLKDTKVIINSTKVVHQPLSDRGTKKCFRGYSDTVEFVDGKIYPCCAGSGLPSKINLDLCEDWQSKILTVEPPCHECLFAEK